MDDPVLLIADDLSGAAEAAAAFHMRAPRIIELQPSQTVREPITDDVVVVDTDSRYTEPDLAAERCRAALAHARPGGTVLKKIDSALRGPLAAELAALREPGELLIATPALPALGRTVLGGEVRINGVPLRHSAAWAAETRTGPATVAEALAPLPVSEVALSVVRGGADQLMAALRAAAAADRVAICDAETDTDLDRLVAAGIAVGAAGVPVRWAGAAGLAYALARAYPGDPHRTNARPNWSATGPILFVVGTAAPAARAQLTRLAEQVEIVVELGPDLLARAADPAERNTLAAEVTERTAGRTAVVQLAEAAGAPRSPNLVEAMARAVAQTARTHPTLLLTGGETARAVLTAIEIDELVVREAWQDGVVLSTAPDGRAVLTRPGAFGDPDALARIARQFRAVAGSPDQPQPHEEEPQ